MDRISHRRFNRRIYWCTVGDDHHGGVVVAHDEDERKQIMLSHEQWGKIYITSVDVANYAEENGIAPYPGNGEK